MDLCKHCNSKLVVTGIQPGQAIRCANCSSVTNFGIAEKKVAADHLAWRSLYLGIASIFLMFFAGIPAIYYGVRSLLRMRITRTKQTDQTAAAAGVVLGGCIGICFWGMVLLIGISAAVVFSTYSESNEPDEVARMCSEEFEIHAPESLEPWRAVSLLGIKEFYFYDRIENADGEKTRRMGLLAMSSPKNPQTDGAFMANLKTHRIGRGNFSIKDSATLEWEFSGNPVDVKKLTFAKNSSAEDSSEVEVKTIQYYGIIDEPGRRYALSIIYDPKLMDISEEEIKEIFATAKVLPRKPKT